jgi:hypothetical protein
VNRRSFFTYGALGVLTVLSALLASEVALRALKRYATGTTAELGFNEPDDRLGWRSRANYEVRYRRKTADGVAHMVLYSAGTDGFRLYGNVNAKRPKLLIIGDSFTQTVNVTTHRTYGALLSNALDMEVFSYGAGGLAPYRS